MSSFPNQPDPRLLWADLGRLMNYLDRVINAGGEDWLLDAVVSSPRWAPAAGSPLEADLRLLTARAASLSGPLTVDRALALIESEVFDAPLIPLPVVEEEEAPVPVPPEPSGPRSPVEIEGVEVPDPPEEEEPPSRPPQPPPPRPALPHTPSGPPLEIDAADLMQEGEGGAALAMLLAPALSDPSDQERLNAGGWFSEEGGQEDLTSQDLRALRAVIERHLRATDSGIEGEGRTDWSRFTQRLVTGQGGLLRERRAERGPARGVAFLPDVSGSCAAISAMTLSVCWGVARHYERFVVVPHSNGYHSPQEAPPPPDLKPASTTPLTEPAHWVDFLTSREVEWVVALGDWDASHLYGHLAAAGFKVLWVDPRAGRTARPVNQTVERCFPAGAPAATARRMSYWLGADRIRTIAQAVEAGFRALAQSSTTGLEVK